MLVDHKQELQFADGMTKQSAASLLAQRLRSHTTCLKPDPNFTASKKKTLESRKQSQMRYALTKPLAQMAMFASLATTTTAHSIEHTDNFQDHLMDNQNFIFLTGFTLMVAMLRQPDMAPLHPSGKQATAAPQNR